MFLHVFPFLALYPRQSKFQWVSHLPSTANVKAPRYKFDLVPESHWTVQIGIGTKSSEYPKKAKKELFSESELVDSSHKTKSPWLREDTKFFCYPSGGKAVKK